MFKKEIEALNEESKLIEKILNKYEKELNATQNALFSGDNIDSLKLSELALSMNLSGYLSSRMIDNFNNSLKKFTKKLIFRIFIVLLLNSLVLFFPSLFYLSPLLVLYIYFNKEDKAFFEFVKKRNHYHHKFEEYFSRYDNYQETINERLIRALNNVDDDKPTLKEPGLNLDLLTNHLEMFTTCLGYVNDLIEDKIKISDIPEFYLKNVTLIFQNNLGTENDNLEELVSLAKSETKSLNVGRVRKLNF